MQVQELEEVGTRQQSRRGQGPNEGAPCEAPDLASIIAAQDLQPFDDRERHPQPVDEAA